MAHTRSLKPGFFLNERLAEYHPLTRILFEGLWCQADREGRLEDRPKKIKAEALPYDDHDVDNALQDLHDAEFILRYRNCKASYIQILAFGKHQHPHPREAPSVIPEPDLGNAKDMPRHGLSEKDTSGAGSGRSGKLSSTDRLVGKTETTNAVVTSSAGAASRAQAQENKDKDAKDKPRPCLGNAKDMSSRAGSSFHPSTLPPGSSGSSEKRFPTSKKQKLDLEIANSAIVEPLPQVVEKDNATGRKRLSRCPHQAIIDLYHEILPMCVQVGDWTPTRAAVLAARWREDQKRQNLEWWRGYFTFVANSKFLTGRAPPTRGRKPFRASLPWLTKLENLVKVAEDQYHA